MGLDAPLLRCGTNLVGGRVGRDAEDGIVIWLGGSRAGRAGRGVAMWRGVATVGTERGSGTVSAVVRGSWRRRVSKVLVIVVLGIVLIRQAIGLLLLCSAPRLILVVIAAPVVEAIGVLAVSAVRRVSVGALRGWMTGKSAGRVGFCRRNMGDMTVVVVVIVGHEHPSPTMGLRGRGGKELWLVVARSEV